MDATLDMKVNRLPARTWNWLRMNEARVEGVQVVSENEYKAGLPENVQRRRLTASAAGGAGTEFDGIPTGMGEDMQKLYVQAGISSDVYEIPAGTRVGEPIKLSFHYEDGAQQMNAVDVKLAEGSSAVLIMDYTSQEQAKGRGIIRTRILAERDAQLSLVQIQRLGGEFDCMNDVGIRCADNAKVRVYHLILGGKNTWQGCEAALEGRHAEFAADIGYRAGKQSRLDMNYVVRHLGRETVSEINSAGVLKGEAFKLFRGTIDFIRGCAGSVGNEKEDVLLLDAKVINQTIPLILCAEEDVEGNHGATIGQLDEELMFYLTSRGLPEEAVYQMLARARIDAVCRKIPDARTVEELEAYLDAEEHSYGS